MGLFSTPKKRDPRELRINRDPNSSYSFSGSEHRARPGIAAVFNRSTSANQANKVNTGFAIKNSSSQIKSSSSVKGGGNSNFKLKF